MSEKRISHCQGKGSLTHNNRKFNAKNVDDTRTKDNIVFVQQPIEEAYEHLFGAAIERYKLLRAYLQTQGFAKRGDICRQAQELLRRCGANR